MAQGLQPLVGLNANALNHLVVSTTAGTTTASTSFDVLFDTTAPVLTLNGQAGTAMFATLPSLIRALWRTTASTPRPRLRLGHVDSTKVGTYVLTYTATDCAGNIATTTRTVDVVLAGGGGGGSSGGSSSGSSILRVS